MQSKLTDGEQVEPAPAKPVNGHVPRARQTNWELAREYPSWLGINVCQLKKPDIRKQSYLSTVNQVACKRGGVHIRPFRGVQTADIFPLVNELLGMRRNMEDQGVKQSEIQKAILRRLEKAGIKISATDRKRLLALFIPSGFLGLIAAPVALLQWVSNTGLEAIAHLTVTQTGLGAAAVLSGIVVCNTVESLTESSPASQDTQSSGFSRSGSEAPAPSPKERTEDRSTDNLPESSPPPCGLPIGPREMEMAIRGALPRRALSSLKIDIDRYSELAVSCLHRCVCERKEMWSDRPATSAECHELLDPVANDSPYFDTVCAKFTVKGLLLSNCALECTESALEAAGTGPDS